MKKAKAFLRANPRLLGISSFLQTKKSHRFYTYTFIAGFAIVGVFVLVFASAATSSIQVEPEQGTPNNNVALVRITDPTASAGSYLKFGTFTPPPPPPPGGKIPALSEVGPRGALTSSACGALAPGTYRSLNCTNGVQLQGSGDYTFIDMKIPSIKSQYSNSLMPRSGTVTLDHVETGGLWFENNDAAGGQAGWTIKFSRLYGGVYQALRPKGNGKINVSDSWLLSDGTPPDGTHTEVMQLLNGSQGSFQRVAFSRQPVSNNTVTAVLTIAYANGGTDTQFIDCEVGYFNGSSWGRGGGYSAVYPGESQWVRPRIHGSPTNSWFTPPVSLIDPVYIN